MAKVNVAALKMKLPMGVLEEKVTGLNSSQKALVFLLTLLVLGGGFYYFLYMPQCERLQKLERSITQQRSRLAELKAAAKKVDVIKEELAQSEAELARLVLLLPNEREIPGLLENVSQVGSQVGLENLLFQPQGERVAEFYVSIPVLLNMVGTYHELGVFFDKISKLDRIIKVEGLSLNRQQGSSDLQANCTIYTYRYDEPKEPNPPARPK